MCYALLAENCPSDTIGCQYGIMRSHTKLSACRYYDLFGDDLKAFPNGFKMVAGDSRLRSSSLKFPDPPTSEWTAEDMSQPVLAQRALGFNCLHYAINPPEPSLYRHNMPDKAFLDAHCTSGLRLELMFPSCWNNKDLDTPNHKSHVAYPSLLNGGECPENFKTRIPTLFYETIWNTYAFKDRQGQFVLANGDPTGKYSSNCFPRPSY